VCQTGPDFEYDREACAASPHAPGCPCRYADPIPCYEGPEGTQGIGLCSFGEQNCVAGRWTECTGQHVPRTEICNRQDDDCDGEIDERVTNACGGCSSACDRVDVPATAIAIDGDSASGVERTPEGEITLGTQTLSAPYLWVANDGEETVSKIDVATGREVGRYVSGPAQAVSNRPSRTVVDLRGDAYVVNRAFGGQGSVTKFAGSPTACVDRNRNGRIETSRDANGNGFIESDEMLPWGADECVLWNVPVGPFDAWPRSIAVDAGDDESPAGYVWVGTFFRGGGTGSGVAYRLRADDGLVRAEVPLPEDFHPYGAAGDCRNLIWFQQAGDSGDLAVIDARTLSVVRGPRAPDGRIVRPRGPSGCRGAYGMTVDGRGRVWSAGNACEDVWRFTPGRDDPTDGVWHRADIGNGRTIGIAVDLAGRAWISHFRTEAEGGGAVSAVDGNATPPRHLWTTRLVDRATGRVAGRPMGVGIDPSGHVWLITRDNSCVRPDDGRPTGCAVRVDPDDRTAVELHPVGDSPYTYSDFLGFVARNFTARRGFVRQRVSLCRAVERWGELRVRAETPEGTRIRIRVAAAADPEALERARFSEWWTWSGAPLDVHAMLAERGEVRGRYLLVEVELGLDPAAALPADGLCPRVGDPPRLQGLEIYAACAVGIE
jgi:DNA-binding beta-propeller fold protein YncE